MNRAARADPWSTETPSVQFVSCVIVVSPPITIEVKSRSLPALLRRDLAFSKWTRTKTRSNQNEARSQYNSATIDLDLKSLIQNLLRIAEKGESHELHGNDYF